MNKINVYYAKVPNMGDLLNKDIIKKCYGYEVIRNNYLTGKVSGIGSGLGNYTYEDEMWKNVLKFLFGTVYPKVYIWGTGFVRYKTADGAFCKKQTEICALRGELSRKRVEKIKGEEMSVPLADAGILASTLLDKYVEKKYRVGVIAHYKEQDHYIFKDMIKKYNDSIFIDVKKSPQEVVNKIAECEIIISSSLHGLIIADSLRIPNHHIVVTNNLLGDGFKFDDYYSGYGLKHEYTDINRQSVPSLSDIETMYQIDNDVINRKKWEIYRAFPYPPKSEDIVL